MSAVGIWEAAIDKYHRFLTALLILENNNEEKIAYIDIDIDIDIDINIGIDIGK